VIGWGGSIGHREDLRTISAALIAWLQRQRHVRFELMCDPVLAEPFAALDGERFRFTMAGSLADYLAWLEELDIGLAPLLPAEFNRCRSDVKFLEHASRAVAPVLQNLDSYRHLCRTGAALLFDNIDERAGAASHHRHHRPRPGEPAESPVEPLLQQAADRPLTSLPGLRQLAQGHWRLGIDSAADQP
jgi:hypothetical protein